MQSASKNAVEDRPAIDPEHLARVTFGDRAFQDEILGLFLSESKTLIDRLASAKDDEAWRLATHTLKGMARGIGAFPLADAAAAAEPLANGLRLERRGAELKRIGGLAGALSVEIEKLIAGQG